MRKQVLLAGATIGALLLVAAPALAQMGGYGMGRDGLRGEDAGGRGYGRGHGHGMGRGQGMGEGHRHGMGRGMHGEMRYGGHGHGRMGQGRFGGGEGPGPGGRGRMQSFAEPAQIEALKREIGITAAQEEAWKEYAKTLQDTAATVKGLREGVDREAVRAMSQADREEFRQKMREAAEKRRATLKAAAEKLLASLEDAQKEVARDALPGLAEPGRGMRSAGPGPRWRQHRH